VEIIDTDLGHSAALGARRREGFERLIAAVAVGEVGLVLSLEASRLSRTDQDWCRLLELCPLFDTLIADADTVYDVSTLDDQLVLGIKATMSVAELKVLHQRMQHGTEAKARRGELVRLLPPGYMRDASGQIVKDPDQRGKRNGFVALTGCEFLGVPTLPPLAVWQAKSGGGGWGRQKNTRHAEAACWIKCA